MDDWQTLDAIGRHLMTHQAEQANPVPGIVEGVRKYLQSGDYYPAHEPGTEPRDYLRELARNPDIMARNIDQASNFAGMAGTLKGASLPVTNGAMKIAPTIVANIEDGGLMIRGLPVAEGSPNEGLPRAWAWFDPKTGELRKTGTHWTATPAPEAVAHAQEIARGLIREHGDALATAGEPVFARYGDIPKGGRSRNFQTGELERGVSALEMRRNLLGGHLEFPPYTDLGYMRNPNGERRPLYEISGKLIGHGSDGEPILSKPQIVREIADSETVPKDPARLLGPDEKSLTDLGM